MNNDLKHEIKSAIQRFSQGNLTENALHLFQTLGYNTERQAPLDRRDYTAFRDSYIHPLPPAGDSQSRFNEKKALVGDWKYVDLLFQLSEEEMRQQVSSFNTRQVDCTIMESYLFFAIELAKTQYSRTELVHITREVNRLFPMPAMLLFKHGSSISLSVINRRLHKRDENKDVLEKVTLIKDIRISPAGGGEGGGISLADEGKWVDAHCQREAASCPVIPANAGISYPLPVGGRVVEYPHRAHIEILFDLSFNELLRVHKFTNFVQLHNAWQKTLDTKGLNEKFYSELFNWYLWASKYVKFPQIREPKELVNKEDWIDDRVHQSESLIRLLTRLLFCWFMKEKGLIREDIFDPVQLSHILKGFKGANSDETIFYKAILQNLFFATLSKPVKERKVIDSGFNPKEYGDPLVYRYAEFFSISEADMLKLFEDIPFLNGGLFECLDQRKDKDNPVEIRLDGFSTKPYKQPVVPDKLFFGEYKGIDLSKEYDDDKKKSNLMVHGLIDILNRYKFTIEENTPIEEEIALDPELLGKVFENLLASYNPETPTSARKQTGSFYTPREIVNYMVDESLYQYLSSNQSVLALQSNQTVPVCQSNQTVPVCQSNQTVPVCGGNLQYRTETVRLQYQTVPVCHEEAETFLNPNKEINISYGKHGKLPHWQQGHVWYFVTFRLADSLPAEKIQQLNAEREKWLKMHGGNLDNLSEQEMKEYYKLFSERVEDWLNAGYGKCILKQEEVAKMVADALLHFNNQRYLLDEWVIMPNHVHVLVKPMVIEPSRFGIKNYQLSDILHSWKSYTAHKITKVIEPSRFDRVIEPSRFANKVIEPSRFANKKEEIWMHESYDHIVRNESAFNAIKNYIRENPVKANIELPDYCCSWKRRQSEDALVTTMPNRDGSITLPNRDGSITLQSEDALVTLLSYSDEVPELTEGQKQKILLAIDNIKILDPACGSGAFPMGILHKLVHILHKLDPDNTQWKELQFQKAIAETEEAFTIGTKEEQEHRLHEINEIFDQNINDPDYARKLFLIENCIYGVDIQPIAIQISKLRFFISLLVEQKEKPGAENRGFKPLPNLDFKLVAANTLIGLTPQQKGIDFSDSYFDQFDKLTEEYFSAYTPDQKRHKKKEIMALVKSKCDENLQRIKNLSTHHDERFNEAMRDKHKGTIQELEHEKELWQSYLNLFKHKSVGFFETRYFFPRVKEGFDVVIGNPPYGANYSETEKKFFRQHYQSTKTITGKQKGSLDTFTLFIEQGFNQLHKNGTLTYIVPIAITSSDSMTGIHNLLEKNCEEIKVSSYSVRPQPVFENAVVNTSILFFVKTESPCKRILSTKMYRKNKNFNLQHLINNLKFIDVKDQKLIGRYPKISLQIEKEILNKIFACKTNVGALIRKRGKAVYYRTTGGRYFKVITPYSTGSTKEKPIYFDNKTDSSVGAILSSNLFFWFYQIYSNNLDLKSYEIESFPIPLDKLSEPKILEIEKLYKEYLEDIEKNANTRQTTRYANIDSFKEYKIGKSKHIIDKIDDIICPLYGLTKEQIEFIKNYEIEFRLTDED